MRGDEQARSNWRRRSDVRFSFIARARGLKSAANGDALVQGRFSFEAYEDGLAFAVRVGFAAEKRDHHPDLHVGWRKVEVVWTTHDAGGITGLDIEMAEASDKIRSMSAEGAPPEALSACLGPDGMSSPHLVEALTHPSFANEQRGKRALRRQPAPRVSRRCRARPLRERRALDAALPRRRTRASRHSCARCS